MIGQKGGLLDKIKAFFIRRRNNKLKKKEQEQKELEQILKNISEKVESPSTVVRVGYAVDKINLKKAVLTVFKGEIRVLNKTDIKDNNETKGSILVDTKSDNTIKFTEQEIAYETINIMDSNELHKLREKLLAKSSVQHEEDTSLNKNTNDKTSKQVSNPLDVPTNVEQLKQNNILAKKDISLDKDSKNITDETNQTNIQISIPLNNSKTNVEQPKKQMSDVKSEKTITINKKVAKRIKVVSSDLVRKKDISSFKFRNKKLNNNRKEQEVSLILIRMIDRNLAELSYFKEELDYLTDKNKNAKTKEEIFEIEQRFLILKERLEKVYNDFLIYRDKNIVQEVGMLSYNEELVDLITKYKLDVRDNDNIEQILRNIENDYKESLNIIESIVCLEEGKEILGDEIYKNKEDIRVRDEELAATDETLDKINFMKEELDRNISSNKEVINSIMEKINSISKEERVRYQFNIVNNLINSALNFSFAKAMLNPRNGRLSNALGATCMLNSIRSLGRIFTPHKEVYFVASDDFENEIIEHLNDFSYINKSIDLSIEEIDKIKNEFDDKYLHLIDDIPEISETYLKINDLQDQLKDIKVEMKHQEIMLEHSRNLNNQMVKRIENN